MRAAAETNDRAAGQCHFQTEHIISRHAVFQAARAARVGGDVAPDAAVRAAGRVGRIIKPLLLDRLVQMLRDHTRLHHRDKVVRIDLLDAVHPRQREHDAPARWNTSAHVTVARAARSHRQVVPMSETEDRGDGTRAPRQGHGVRQATGEPFVAGMALKRVAVEPQLAGRQFALQLKQRLVPSRVHPLEPLAASISALASSA